MYFTYPSWPGALQDPSLPPPPPGFFTAPDLSGRSRTYYSKPWSGSFVYEVDPHIVPPAPPQEWRYRNPNRAADDSGVDYNRDYVHPMSYPPPPRPVEEEYFDLWDYVRMYGPRQYPHPPPHEGPIHAPLREFPPQVPREFPSHHPHSYAQYERWARFKAWERAPRKYHSDEAQGQTRREKERHDWGHRPWMEEWFQGRRARPEWGGSGDEWSWWRRMPRSQSYSHPHDHSHSYQQPPPHPKPAARPHPTRPRANSSPERFETTLGEAFAAYDAAWAAFSQDVSNNTGDNTIKSAGPLTFRTVPWPQHPAPHAPEDIDPRRVRDFMGAGGGGKVRLREALLRFHPDKIAPLLARVVDPADRACVATACEAVTRCLGEMMRGGT